MTKCVACSTPMIHTKILCSVCTDLYPGILEKAKRQLALEDKAKALEDKRQQKIQDRRLQMRAI